MGVKVTETLKQNMRSKKKISKRVKEMKLKSGSKLG